MVICLLVVSSDVSWFAAVSIAWSSACATELWGSILPRIDLSSLRILLSTMCAPYPVRCSSSFDSEVWPPWWNVVQSAPPFTMIVFCKNKNYKIGIKYLLDKLEFPEVQLCERLYGS